MKVPEKYRYKVAEIQQLLEENIRAHISKGNFGSVKLFL